MPGPAVVAPAGLVPEDGMASSTIMRAIVTPDRASECVRVVRSVAEWAAEQRDIVGVAIVGSWAREQARMDSDLDLVILTDDRERYLSDGAWARAVLGEPAELIRTQRWGPLTERRVALPSGLEIEFGFVPPGWASVDPVDPGTARVVADRCSPLLDPQGAFTRLISAVGDPERRLGGMPMRRSGHPSP